MRIIDSTELEASFAKLAFALSKANFFLGS